MLKLKYAIESEMENIFIKREKELKDWIDNEVHKIFKNNNTSEMNVRLTREIAAQKLSFSNLNKKYASLQHGLDELQISHNGIKNWNDILRSKLHEQEIITNENTIYTTQNTSSEVLRDLDNRRKVICELEKRKTLMETEITELKSRIKTWENSDNILSKSGSNNMTRE